MKLSSKHKVDPAFNMSSMTDIVFLLLVFFMLTSTFITPSALPVSTPSKNKSTNISKKVKLEITKDLRYYVDNKEVSYERLKGELQRKISISNTDKDVIVVQAHKKIKYNEVMKVAGLAAELNVKISLAQK